MNNRVLTIVVAQLIVVLTVYTFPLDEDLYEGSPCTLENGKRGVCKKLPDCPSRLAEVQEGKRHSASPGRCGFDDFTEIVCCSTNVTQEIAGRQSDVACQQYDNEIPRNNMTPNELVFHIFGGNEARPGEFPYMVALGYENDDADVDQSPIKYSCGGSLISSQHVLTAAHCVSNVNGKVPVEVRLGNEDITSATTNVQRIPISDIISHPEYKRRTNYNDVAILKLKTKVQLSDTVKPICLQTKSVETITITPNTSLVVIGWGATSFDTENSIKLMRTPNLSIVERGECTKWYTGFAKLPRGIDESMICALDTNSSRRADACQGDSGGPLLMLNERGDSVIGITSFGQSCGSSIPGVYTGIYYYLDWIESHVWTDNEQTSFSRTEITEITSIAV